MRTPFMRKLLDIKLVAGIMAIFCTLTSSAQDLHFSQYFNTPLLVNPANTGFAPESDYRVGVNYRNQWSSILNNPYKTMSAWADAQAFGNRLNNGWLGIGGALQSDVAGSGGLTSTRAYGNIAYHQLLGINSLLSMGFSVGYASKRIDFTKLSFDDQWNGKFFDVTIPNGEPFAYSRVSYLDLGVGMNYAFFPSDNTYLNVGVSISHINQPRESFFSNSLIDQRVDARYNVFLNGMFKLNDQWIINPNAYVSKMGTAWETVVGMNANYNLSGDGFTQMIAGLYYRGGDAFIPMIGYQLNDFKLTFSYDATTSFLKNYNQSRGAYEISLVKTGLYNSGGKNVKCPTVKF